MIRSSQTHRDVFEVNDKMLQLTKKSVRLTLPNILICVMVINFLQSLFCLFKFWKPQAALISMRKKQVRRFDLSML